VVVREHDLDVAVEGRHAGDCTCGTGP